MAEIVNVFGVLAVIASSSALNALDDSIVRRVVEPVDVVGNTNRRALLAVTTSTPAFSVLTIERERRPKTA
jgi:hypothetical protein